MASKKKKHAAAASDEKPRKKRKRKAAKRSKRKAGSSSSAPKKKRGRKPLQLLLRVEDTAINSPSLSKLSDGQRVDLAAMNPKRSFTTRPAWATDEATWRKSIRLVSPKWKHLSNPWATVARVYLLLEGPIGHGRGHVEREHEREAPKQRARRTSSASSSSSAHEYDQGDGGDRVHVERLKVDETGIDQDGEFRGRGIWWRVWNASIDGVVSAATGAAARAMVMGRG